MNDDERFEEFLRDAAAEYQAPRGAVPRDEMWAAIQAQRAATASVAPIAPDRPVRVHGGTRQWMWVGMAATLALGVLVGRYAWRADATQQLAAGTSSPTGVVVTAPSPSVATAPSTSVVAAPSTSVTTAPSASRAPSTPEGTSPATHSSNERLAAAPSGSAPYAVASARHLQAVQVLLASFAADPADARSDSLVSAWARGLLSNTRLLLDSPAARDPQRARLLQDLEVILVQLVQRAPGGDVEARSAVERSIQKSQIIPRLRSALPASLQSGTE